MNRFKVGDQVQWESHSQGHRTRKDGFVVEVVPAGYLPAVDRQSVIPIAPFGDARKSDSYLIEVQTRNGSRLYWPRANKLELVR